MRKTISRVLRRLATPTADKISLGCDLVSGGNHEAAKLLFRQYLDKHEPETASEIIGEAVNSLGEPGLTSREHLEITRKVKSQIEGTQHNSLPPQSWLSLCRIVTSVGFIEAGTACRDRAINSALGSAGRPIKSHLESAQAALEYGNYDLCRKSLDAGLNHEILLLFKNQLNYIYGESKAENECFQKRRFHENRSLTNLDSIAFVGPAVSPSDNSGDIDSHDVVVRCGYSGLDSIPNRTGMRTDVAFYAGHKIRGLFSTGKLDALRDLRLVIVKHRSDYELLRRSGFDEECVQTSIGGGLLFYATAPNAGIEAILNCLYLGAKQVKVYNTDLFLSDSYPSGYITNKSILPNAISTYSVPKMDMCVSFGSGHHPAAQFRFYKRMYEMGKVSGDPVFDEIMNMELVDYLRRLDLLYGRVTWDSIRK